jgi:hypothetical protein
MEFFKRDFKATQINLYPLGDWHYGSEQCDEDFVKRMVTLIAADPIGYWVGMGDFMENAIIGSKSDLYTQREAPKAQLEWLAKTLKPIAKKGLFMLAGNHEQRTMRVVGLCPEDYLAEKIGVPFLGFSVFATLRMMHANQHDRTFNCFFHHGASSGSTVGAKVAACAKLRLIAPAVDALFCGHSHITNRAPVSWWEPGRERPIKKTGYNYITGSALTWNKSYAEEKGYCPSSVEHIAVTMQGATSGSGPKRQSYTAITPIDL